MLWQPNGVMTNYRTMVRKRKPCKRLKELREWHTLVEIWGIRIQRFQRRKGLFCALFGIVNQWEVNDD